MFDPVLFGVGQIVRLVAVEADTETGQVKLWRRDPDGKISTPPSQKLVPWLLIDKCREFPGANTTSLTGYTINVLASQWRFVNVIAQA